MGTCVNVMQVLVHHNSPGRAVGVGLDDEEGGVLVLDTGELGVLEVGLTIVEDCAVLIFECLSLNLSEGKPSKKYPRKSEIL